ncbi:hemolysin family protein [Rice orange leaf phytoplasma]|uniref:hemolysin family protein n=1 Tax=Rice orange leaf phytoplasma TaxID=146897 RepID=UPI0008F59C42|nr:hemolysin family protein [Rice orange leaf phytoplasma]OIJ44760.1 hemolysin [Rice orange leaf phytoplasma]
MNPIVILIILIALNAFFAACEISFISTNESKIELDIKKGNKNALRVKKIKTKPTTFLSVIQIMIHIITFFQGNIVTSCWLRETEGHFSLHNIGIEALIITLSIIFGELIPKRIAMHAPSKIAYLFSGSISLIAWLITPLVWILTQVSNLFLIVFGLNPNKNSIQVSEDELRLMLTSSYQKGIIDKDENKMIQNIFEFDHTNISEVMRHRTEVVAIDVEITKKELIKTIQNEKYTRFPVYENSIDNIIGILHVKDIFNYLMSSNPNKIFDLKKFIRKPYLVPDTKNTNEFFREMKKTKTHMAIVIDEYGGTAGIITFEDLIEEILGEISDEYDNEDLMIKEVAKNEYIVNGFADLEEVAEAIKLEFNTEDYDTLSGFLIGQLGRFPKPNDKNTEIIYKNFKFTILKHNDKVISQIKITKIDLQEEIK